jgi:hypothetical protein
MTSPVQLRRTTKRTNDPREQGGWLLYLGKPNLVIGWHRERLAGMTQCWLEITGYGPDRFGPRKQRRAELELPREFKGIPRRGPFSGVVIGPGHFTFDIGWRSWRSGK